MHGEVKLAIKSPGRVRAAEGLLIFVSTDVKILVIDLFQEAWYFSFSSLP